jgi:hypothetical protein
MSIPSNLYAEKVFGEHPIALWPLDENVDYLQLIPAENRFVDDTNVWSVLNCTVSESFSLDSPIHDESVYQVSSSASSSFSLLGQDIITDYVNEDLGSLTVGFYFYPASSNISQVELGYSQRGNEFSKTFNISEYNTWKYLSNTFALQDQDSLVVAYTDLTITAGEATIINKDGHGLVDGDKIRLDSSYLLPDNLNGYGTYYVVDADENSFSIEEDLGSGGIEFTYSEYGVLLVKPINPISVFIRYTLNNSSVSTSFVSGISVGQWSAEFMESSMGLYPEEIEGINIEKEYFGISFPAYGLEDSPGYYLSRENKLLAKNTSMPLTFGSNNLTSILPERFGGPSLIVPGKGFLNEDGRYKTYTIEMWLRLDPETLVPKRIFGPISSSDGLYVDGPFLSLKIGGSIQSHYIGEWYRPMLVNILVFRNGASMTINGEKVLDISFDSSELELPPRRSLAGKDQDWLGFYSYNDIANFEIDCVGIYSYRVPTAIAKRRWVYGQGVDFPTDLPFSYRGESFLVDYTFADYGNNHSYPDIARWSQGTSENMSFKNKVLQPPEYKLPSLVFNNKTSDSWFRALKNNTFMNISLKPDQSWADTDGYLFFDQPQILQQKTVGFYGVFEPRLGFDSDEILFRLENQITGSYLTINLETESKNIASISGSTIVSNNHGLKTNDIVKFVGSLPPEIIPTKEYFVLAINKDSFSIKASRDSSVINLSSVDPDSVQVVANFIRYRMLFGSPQEVLVYQTPAITTGSTIVAGIDFSRFANFFGSSVSSFMNNRRQLRLYVGGNKNFEKTFSGRIQSVGFSTARNIQQLKYLFSSNGTPFLRYQFEGGEYGDAFPEQTEIADSGYIYDDYINDIISHVASYKLTVRSFFGERYLDIATSSYWQDYVPLSYFAKNFVDEEGKTRYGLDFIQYNSDVAIPNSFDAVDNQAFYDNDNSLIKTYISFQSIAAGPTRTEESFLNTEKLSRSRVITPGTNWINTKFEVVSGTIIYPPSGVNINDIAIVIHVDISSRGILKNPIRIRSLSLSSQTVNATVSKPVKTRFGVPSFPYTRYGLYFDYKKQNPYSIYKDSTPHLYLTKHSGLELTGEFGTRDRGIGIVVNREQRAPYDLAAINFAMRFSRDDLVSAPTEIVQIEDSGSREVVRLWIEPSVPSNKRFRLFVTDKNNNDISRTVKIHINGRLVTNTVFSINDWNMITLTLSPGFDLSNNSGRINFVGPILFNSVVFFALDSLQDAQSPLLGYRGLSPQTIYGTFVGTNKVILGDDVPIIPINYQYSVINNISERSATVKPV